MNTLTSNCHNSHIIALYSDNLNINIKQKSRHSICAQCFKSVSLKRNKWVHDRATDCKGGTNPLIAKLRIAEVLDGVPKDVRKDNVTVDFELDSETAVVVVDDLTNINLNYVLGVSSLYSRVIWVIDAQHLSTTLPSPIDNAPLTEPCRNTFFFQCSDADWLSCLLAYDNHLIFTRQEYSRCFYTQAYYFVNTVGVKSDRLLFLANTRGNAREIIREFICDDNNKTQYYRVFNNDLIKV